MQLRAEQGKTISEKKGGVSFIGHRKKTKITLIKIQKQFKLFEETFNSLSNSITFQHLIASNL